MCKQWKQLPKVEVVRYGQGVRTSSHHPGIGIARCLPEDEGTDGEANEQRVEQISNLCVLPYEWPLKIRKRNPVSLDFINQS